MVTVRLKLKERLVTALRRVPRRVINPCGEVALGDFQGGIDWATPGGDQAVVQVVFLDAMGVPHSNIIRQIRV